jgi:hypothetical protein
VNPAPLPSIGAIGDVSTYSLVGSEAELLVGRIQSISLICDSGSYAFAFEDSVSDLQMTASAGVFALIGRSANLLKKSVLRARSR